MSVLVLAACAEGLPEGKGYSRYYISTGLVSFYSLAVVATNVAVERLLTALYYRREIKV